jgi:transcription antitermination factor NusG
MVINYWYALTAKARRERAASQYLRDKGFEAFSPIYHTRRRWSDRLKEVELCLFPGYVFCRFSYQERLQVLGTPGIASVVRCAKVPAPVPDAEIASIRTMVRSGRPVEPWPYLRVGEQVRIGQGCLEGLCGALAYEKGCWRVVVNVELLQRSVAVEVDREAVTLVHDLRKPVPHGARLLKAG